MNALPATDSTLAVLRRVAKDDQRGDGYGLDAQATTTREFARREGLTALAEFAAPGVSGTLPR